MAREAVVRSNKTHLSTRKQSKLRSLAEEGAISEVH